MYPISTCRRRARPWCISWSHTRWDGSFTGVFMFPINPEWSEWPWLITWSPTWCDFYKHFFTGVSYKHRVLRVEIGWSLTRWDSHRPMALFYSLMPFKVESMYGHMLSGIYPMFPLSTESRWFPKWNLYMCELVSVAIDILRFQQVLSLTGGGQCPSF